MENTTNNHNNIGLLSRFSRRRKKPQQPLTEFSQLYRETANSMIVYLGLEEKEEYKKAYQGWRALHTHLLYELARVERAYPNVTLYTKDELSLQTGIRELYVKSLEHLGRVRKFYDEGEGKMGQGSSLSGNSSSSSLPSSSTGGDNSRGGTGHSQLMNLRRPAPPGIGDQGGVFLKTLRNSSGKTLGMANQSLSTSKTGNSDGNPPKSTGSKKMVSKLALDAFEGFDEDMNLVDFSDTEETGQVDASAQLKDAPSSYSNKPSSYPVKVQDKQQNGSEYDSTIEEYFDHYLEQEESANVLSESLDKVKLDPGKAMPASQETIQKPISPKLARQPNPPKPPKPRMPKSSVVKRPVGHALRSSTSAGSLASQKKLISKPNGSAPNISTRSTEVRIQGLKSPKTNPNNNARKPAAKRGKSVNNVSSLSKRTSSSPAVASRNSLNGLPIVNKSQALKRPASQRTTPSLTPSNSITKNRPIKRTAVFTSASGTPKSSSVTSLSDTSADNETQREAMEAEIIESLRGVDKAAAKQIFAEIVVRCNQVHWDDIIGLESAKNSLKEAVVYPFLRPDLFRGLREPVRGMLLFGPPGTGKTMLARAVASESHSTFFSISASSLTSKYLGESEKLVRALFAIAKKLSPSIIFVDEIDSILGSRNKDGENESSRRIKNEFLIQWSSLVNTTEGNGNEEDERVLVLAATNLPWSIDEAARRRFVRRQYIPLPEGETRKLQISRLLANQNHTLTEEGFAELIHLTEGYSGSDITSLAKDAAMGPLRELGDKLLLTPTKNIRPIGLNDFLNSLNYIKPSVSSDGLWEHEKWAEKFGSSGV